MSQVQNSTKCFITGCAGDSVNYRDLGGCENDLVRAKEPSRELLSSIVIDLGVNRFLVQLQAARISYCEVRWRGRGSWSTCQWSRRSAVDASIVVRSKLATQVVHCRHCMQRIEPNQISRRTAVASIIQGRWRWSAVLSSSIKVWAQWGSGHCLVSGTQVHF